MCKMMYDTIYLLTAIELTPGGSSTEHIYTQKLHISLINLCLATRFWIIVNNIYIGY
jgi:hypothetical protein